MYVIILYCDTGGQNAQPKTKRFSAQTGRKGCEKCSYSTGILDSSHVLTSLLQASVPVSLLVSVTFNLYDMLFAGQIVFVNLKT